MKIIKVTLCRQGNINVNLLTTIGGIGRLSNHTIVTNTCEDSDIALLAECENVSNLEFEEYVLLKFDFDGNKHNFRRIDPGIGFIDVYNYNETRDICNDLNSDT